MTSLYPSSLRDESNLAFEKCAQKAFDIDLKPFMVYLFDHVSPKLLPVLKKHFAIDDITWELADTEKQKRDLLKNIVPIHRSKGTNAAIKLVLKSLGIEAEVREYFEYQGRPNFFQLVSNSTLPLSDKAQKFLEMLNIYKRKTAHLDKLVVRLANPCLVYQGVALIKTKKYKYQVAQGF